MASTSAAATMSEPRRAPMRLSRPPTSAGANALSPITTMVWSRPESSAMSMPAIDPLRLESAQAHAPAAETQEREQPAIDHGGHDHHQRGAGRNARPADELDRGVGESERL